MLLLHSDVVSLKGGYFSSASNSTDILQRDLLCNGTETNLLECTVYESGTRDCPADHSEDAGVMCNGMYTCICAFIIFSAVCFLSKHIQLYSC